MNNIAILVTVFNRREKTLACLDAVIQTLRESHADIQAKIFLTDDGSTDGTADAIIKRHYSNSIQILHGDGKLYWNGGMIHSWKAALSDGKYDGYLWLNNDTIILPNFWEELLDADCYCREKHGQGGIYVGSTYENEDENDNRKGKKFTYGGFNFTNRLTLRDEFVIPDGTFQSCQCAHGNLTYISRDVVDEMGIFTNEYIHSGGDHDYTYRAYKHGFPLLVLPSFCGICDNDHPEDGYAEFMHMSLKERLRYLHSPLGFNLHNTLVFQRRCFPYRYPFVWVMGHLKALCPRLYWKVYKGLRS